MSLFYPDVVIGRPGARCDALEAQNMIVCIPGARRCYQRAWRVDLGCWIYVHNLRDCAKMDEMLRALLFAPPYFTPHTSHLTLPRASARRSQFHMPRAPHTTHFECHTHCLTLPTPSVGPSQQTIALANMPFSPVPKARGPGPLGRWGPCK